MTPRRRVAAAALLALVALVGASCRESAPPAMGELTVDGRAEVADAEGPFRPVTGSTTLVRPGEVVRVVGGSATLSLGEGRELELREGSTVRLAPEGLGRVPLVELRTGGVLVVAAEAPVTVTAAGSDMSVDGVARLSRGLAVVVASYAGSTQVASAGRDLVVPALRQVSIAAPGLLPPRPSPVSFDAGDEWDERYLGEGIELGRELVARSRELTSELGAGEGTTPGFYRLLVPALEEEPDFGAELLDRDRAPGETLVGAAITVEGDRGTFAERWQQVFRFHDEGASWGIVVLDQGVARSPLIERVDAALARATGTADVAAGGGAGGSGDGGGTGTGSGGTGSNPVAPPGPATTPPPPTPTGTPPGGTPPGGSPPPVPDEPLESTTSSRLGVPVVDDTVDALVDAVGGLLRGLSLD